MTALTTPPSHLAPPPVLPLENGDRLTRIEFERRWAGMPRLKNVELVEGVVHVPPPVTHVYHGAPGFDLIAWLSNYVVFTPGVEGGAASTLRLDLDNAPQPDAYLLILPAHGGQARIDADGYVVGAPELIAEVSASSASIDLHAKLNAYRRNGVREYVVWRVYDRAIDWFVLRDGRYDRLAPDPLGRYRSEVLPGLWLAPAALMAGDLQAVARVVQEGLASPEHAAFVARLQQATPPRP